MKTRILFTVEGTISVEHRPAERACIGTWESLCTTHFREALERALSECGRVGSLTWIIDLTHNPGVPSQADMAWVQGHAISLAKRNGIKALVNVQGTSSVAKMGSQRWSKLAVDGGIPTYDCGSLADALQLAADVASGKAA